ncbi:hypothetical protein [Streptomyces sp. NPDC094049]|uniref:hypothetical protein n=1 Tax=Streptomyces sp. NPDC094049 TaxID=3154987 RepID=UPI0033256C72
MNTRPAPVVCAGQQRLEEGLLAVLEEWRASGMTDGRLGYSLPQRNLPVCTCVPAGG